MVSLTLVIGPANAAKAGEVFGAFRARLAQRPLLVVPTRADVATYERELAGSGALVGGRVLAFGSLVREIAHRANFGAEVATGLARERLVAEAVAGARLDVLSRSAAGRGFVGAAGDFLAELARERVDPGRFAAALRAWAGDDAGRRAYGDELAALHRRYRTALARARRTDEEGFAWGALDALRASPAAWGATPVLLYGFDDLTTPQRDAVETLAGVAGADVWLSLPYEPRAALAGRARTVEELRPVADRVVALAAREDFYAPSARGALHRLERELFEDAQAGSAAAPVTLTLWEEDVPAAPPERPAPGSAIRLLEAGGERAEAELVAAEVARLVAGGIAPEDVAVVHRAPATVAELLGGALAAVGLPLAGEREAPAGRITLGRALVGLLRAALHPDGTADDLLVWLRAPGHLTRPELADALELACRRHRLTTAPQARERWEADVPTFALTALDALAAAARRGTADLLAEVRRQAERLLAAPYRLRPDAQGEWRGTAPVLAGPAAEDARVLAALARALDELAGLAHDGAGAPLAPAELPDLLAQVPVRLGEPPRPGAVLLADPLGIRARRFRAVVVCGLQAGTFPRRARPEPFLGEDERDAIAAASGLRIGRPRDALAEERALFYACASRPTDALRLSFRTSDEEGNREAPSPFVADVQALFAPLETLRRPLADVTWPLAAAPTDRERARAEAAGAPRERPPLLGDLELERVRALARHQSVLSAGALESYAACPVSWLVEKELDPAELAPDHDRLRRGSFIHAVLERTFAELREHTGTARITEGNRPRAEGLLHEIVEQERGKLEAELPRTVARSAVRAAEADLRRHLRVAAATGELPWEPADLELRFGFADDPESRPALVVGTGEDAVRVRGAIDRLDVDPAGRALVRDYKSGARQLSWAGGRWLEEDRLQVALYMLAARDLLGLLPVGGLYVPLRGGEDGDLRPRGLVRDEPELRESGAFVATDLCPEEGVDAILGAVEARVGELARELRAGRLTPRPESCSGRGCRYPGICRSAAA